MNILIVDDDKTNLTILKAMLHKDGHLVRSAHNGLEAIDSVTENIPDLILMDLMMPEMDGYAATQIIKERFREHYIPIIFLTGVTDENMLARCVESGGDDFLSKPYSRVILNAKIQAHMRVKHLYETQMTQTQELSYHHERLKREQQIAERIFTRIVHTGCLAASNIKYLLSPVAVFNGDLLLAGYKPSGGMHIMLGDFTGHGLPAAIGAMPVADIFYGMTKKGFSIMDIVLEINDKLRAILPTGLFCSTCLAEVDATGNTISVFNAGLPDIILCDSQGKVRKKFGSNHLPLGVVSSHEIEKSLVICETEPGERLIIYSDGLIESTSSDGTMYGQDRLEQVINGCTDPVLIFETLCQSQRDFVSGGDQLDDITLLEVVLGSRVDASTDISPFKNRDPLHWQVCFDLYAEDLKAREPIQTIVQMVMDAQQLYDHRSRLHTLLMEMYSNAFEHGVLGLDSKLKKDPSGFAQYYMQRQEKLETLADGRISVRIEHRPNGLGGVLKIEMEDSGQGFDFQSYLNVDKTNKQFSGRGISLLKGLGRQVEFFRNGSGVRVEYVWED